MPPSEVRKTDVLIAGAGPTGLVLALWLARAGVRVRIIDKAAQPGTTSRALVVHARTLEFYRQLGLADDVVARGLRFTAINLWARGKHVGRADFSDIGDELSPFPNLVIFPQDEHERLLIEHLQRAGVVVERNLELVAFDERGRSVVAYLQGPGGTRESCEAMFLCGCDGASSRLREMLGTGFPGGTYERLYYVADVALHGPVNNHELHIALDDADFLAVFPLKGDNTARLIGTVLPEAEHRGRNLAWADVSSRVITRMQITVDRVNWFSTYHVHHRVSHSFRRRRCFLLGDAAHVHSPVGAQGMNTGIGDAINLAWKLAAVAQGRSGEALLDSYEPERIGFARRLVATTDRVFTLTSRDGWLARFIRLKMVPWLVPWLVDRERVRRFMFRTVSQILIAYRESALSEGRAGRVHGGDRLPWVKPASGSDDNFTPLRSCDWQVHVYGEATPGLVKACAERSLALHSFAWRPAMRDAGLMRGAGYLVRPDGYVALAGADAGKLRRYLDAHGLTNDVSPAGR